MTTPAPLPSNGKEERRDDPTAPYSERMAEDLTENYLLTHARWCPFGKMTSGTFETGYRKLVDGKAQQDSFFLIQHGWYNWKLARDVIKRLLAKGRTPNRIHEIMNFIQDRRRFI